MINCCMLKRILFLAKKLRFGSGGRPPNRIRSGLEREEYTKPDKAEINNYCSVKLILF